MRWPGIPALLTFFLVAVGVAWLMTTPPGSAPDEDAHYVKAIGAGGGDLRGKPAVPTAAQREAFFRGDRRKTQAFLRGSRTTAVRWQARTRRQFTVPSRLIATEFGCTAFSPDRTGECTNAPHPHPLSTEVPSYVGTYQPYVYLPAGAAMRLAGDPHTALRTGRAVGLVICAGLLLAALWLLWDPAGPRTSVLGWALAVTPMVVFVSTVLSPSGPEVAGAVCFAAGLLRLTRGQPATRWLWVALAAGGATLACARALGPAFAVLLFVGVLALTGPRRGWAQVRAGGAMAALSLGAVVAAGLAGAVWEFAVQPRPAPSTSSLVDALGPSIANLPTIAKQAVGVFGAADAPMPWLGYSLWALALAVAVAAALAVGGRSERAGLVALAAGTVTVVLGMSLVYREIGPLQGRYALPLLVLFPLWAGELVHRRRAALSPGLTRALGGATLALVAGAQAIGWATEAHRFAVGQSGPWEFLDLPAWSPPGGWAPWALLAVAGTASCLAAGVAAARRDLD